MAPITPPVCFTYGNVVFARDLRDAWACFRVATQTFDGLTLERKIGLFQALRSSFVDLRADFQIARMGTEWDAERWGEEALGLAHPDRAALTERRVEETIDEIGASIGRSVSVVFIAVRLAEPTQDLGAHLSTVFERPARAWVGEMKRSFQMRDRRLLRGTALEQLRSKADAVQAHLSDFLEGVRPARSAEIQWWIRRQFTRGLGEPVVDGFHEPQALVFESNGEAVLQPLAADVVRWTDSIVEPGTLGLTVHSELGTSHQASLVLGALPELAFFPSPRLQVMFSPVEALPFAVDLSLNCRYIPNGLAIKMVRRRIQDADEIVRAEDQGDQGASDQALDRRESVRELLRSLQSGDQPPLLMGSLAIALGAASSRVLEQKIAHARRQWGPEIKLHRPLGDQLSVFMQQFPGQSPRAIGYDAPLTCEQVAAMLPTATHTVGPRRGFLRGWTLTGTRQPVRCNVGEGSESNSPTGILLTGSPGRGKTQLVQEIKAEVFERGGRTISIDAKGDHRFHELAEIRDHAETIDVTRPSYAGLIDPLLVAPEELRSDLTISWLTQLLPRNAPAEWQTAVHKAVAAAIRAHARPTCGHVVLALKSGDAQERKVGDALEVFAAHGLTRPGFADPDRLPPRVGDAPVIYIPIRQLPGSSADTPRDDRTRDEIIGDALLQQLAAFAVHQFSAYPAVLNLLDVDEAHRLLDSSIGRRLAATSKRMGRSEGWVGVFSSQNMTDHMVDDDSAGNLIGEIYAFGVKTETEARQALKALGRDPDDQLDIQLLIAFGEEGNEGRAVYRDHRGRSEAIQVWIRPSSLARTDTNPTRREAAAQARAAAT